MTWVISAIGVVARLLGFAGALERWLQSRKDQQIGAQAQSNKDMKETLNDVSKAEDARISVDSVIASKPDSLRDTDGFRRD